MLWRQGLLASYHLPSSLSLPVTISQGFRLRVTHSWASVTSQKMASYFQISEVSLKDSHLNNRQMNWPLFQKFSMPSYWCSLLMIASNLVVRCFIKCQEAYTSLCLPTWEVGCPLPMELKAPQDSFHASPVSLRAEKLFQQTVLLWLLPGFLCFAWLSHKRCAKKNLLHKVVLLG